jgi:sugar lactone lactonase YvrE
VGGAGIAASGSSALAVDASGNIWITNKSINSVSEWSNLGAAISPYTSGTTTGGFTYGDLSVPGPMAIDPSGYLWIVNGNGTLAKLDPNGYEWIVDGNGTATRANIGTSVFGSPFSGGGLATGVGIAIDGPGNVWITNSGPPGGVAKFNSRGIALSPVSGYTNGMVNPSVIAIDNSNNVWVQNENSTYTELAYVKLSNTNGVLVVGVTLTEGTLNGQWQLAVDTSGNVWSTDGYGPASIGLGGAGVIEVPAAYTGLSTDQPPVDTAWVDPPYGSVPTIGDPQGLAFDGSDRLWIANLGGGVNTQSPNLTLMGDSTSPISTSYSAPSFANGPLWLAVDGSGNVWVLLSNNTVTEFVGIATPTVAPLALAVKNAKLGVKP